MRAPEHVAVSGRPVGETSTSAPYFEFLLLAGRPERQRRDLLVGFTEVVVDVLGVDLGEVRGRAVEIDPAAWSIGGVPASERRATEIASRSGTAAS